VSSLAPSYWAMRLTSRLLELGALYHDNYASCSSWIDNHPIDLKSNHPQVLEQDFFERPLPRDSLDYFDIISCSLVLNFVSEPTQRGKQSNEAGLTNRTNARIDSSTASTCTDFSTLFGVTVAMCGKLEIPLGDSYAGTDGGRRIRNGQGKMEERGQSWVLAMGLEGTQDWASEEEIRKEAGAGRWAQEEQF
jgi:hypothetical protein